MKALSTQKVFNLEEETEQENDTRRKDDDVERTQVSSPEEKSMEIREKKLAPFPS